MFKLWIISAFFAIHFTTVISDDFLAISYPESLAFDASTTTISLKQIKYTLMAIVAEAASTNGEFEALKINNIFKMPKLAVLVTIKLDNTADYSALGGISKYQIQGRAPGGTFRGIIDFEKLKTRQTLTNVSNDIDFVRLEGHLAQCKIAEAKAIAHELRNLLTSNTVEHIVVDVKAKYFVGVHLFNENAALEFGKLVGAIKKLKELLTGLFFAVFTYGPDSNVPNNQSTTSSTIIDPIEFKQHNIAPAYDENYAIIFNIILWFMVAFGLSLIAVVLAIINMDPGRDSIIYRMTATRSKKDV